MIVIDTHIWIWWVNRDGELTDTRVEVLDEYADGGSVYLSRISLWEVAKSVEYDILELTEPVDEWLRKAVSNMNVQLIPLTRSIVVGSTQLPGDFPNDDPGDQLIVVVTH